MVRRLAGVLVLALLLTACSGSKSDGEGARPSGTTAIAGPATEPTAPPPTEPAYPVFTVATATVPTVRIFDEPGAATASRSLRNPNPMYETPRIFLVKEERGDWLNVLLPMRPNGSTGWIQRSDVELAHHDYRMVVELDAHRLTVFQKNEIILQEPVGVGTGTTPTPGGIYYTTELLIPVGQPAYGPYAYGLSGYSEVLYDFAGGDGQFGMHGTNDPSSVGRDVSNGCIRLDNNAITTLAERLPIGVPVEIKA
jgi:lipoprotein-anchoring transpeptidase ErfK/SrfK